MDSFEDAKNLQRVKYNYRIFAQSYPNCQLVLAENPEEAVFEEVKHFICATLNVAHGEG